MTSADRNRFAPLTRALSIVALSVSFAATATAQSFFDVPTNHWAYEFIEEMLEREITSGCGGGAYCPDDLVTRAQMAVFLIRTLGRPRVSDGNDTDLGRLVSVTDDRYEIDVLSAEGYLLRVDLRTGGAGGAFTRQLFFAELNCAGQPYTDSPSGWVDRLSTPGGQDALYYTEKSGLPSFNVDFQSQSTTGGCMNLSGTWPVLYPALPNDPVVTGVADELSYVLPIRMDP